MNKPIEVFISYSHRDEALKDRLLIHLDTLRREALISAWHDRLTTPGREWEGAIDYRLNSAGIILLLVSPDFLASGYCYDIEVKRAMERHHTGEARVIPIIVRVCDWRSVPFAKLQALPKRGKAVTQWRDRDAAWLNVAEGIRRTIAELSSLGKAASGTLAGSTSWGAGASRGRFEHEFVLVQTLFGDTPAAWSQHLSLWFACHPDLLPADVRWEGVKRQPDLPLPVMGLGLRVSGTIEGSSVGSARATVFQQRTGHGLAAAMAEWRAKTEHRYLCSDTTAVPLRGNLGIVLYHEAPP